MAAFLEVIKTPGATDSPFMGYLNGPCCLTLPESALQTAALTGTEEGISSGLAVSCVRPSQDSDSDEEGAQWHSDSGEQNLSCLEVSGVLCRLPGTSEGCGSFRGGLLWGRENGAPLTVVPASVF